MSAPIHVGVSGWSYPDWAGIVYPQPRPKGFSELGYMAEFLDAMELNVTFYRPPPPAMSERWLRQVEHKPGFRFTAKLWQRFTHDRAASWSDAEARRFKEGLRPLREAGRLGALLAQFPWSFKPSAESHDWLDGIAGEFGDMPCVVELRHADWNTPEQMDFLRALQLDFCNIDQPPARSGMGRTSLATGSTAYYRFHGRNAKAWFDEKAGRDDRYNYLYSESELSPWALDIAAMARQTREVFVMANNHYQGQAVVNALQIKSQITGQKVRAPRPLLRAYPALKPYARPLAGQEELFE